MENECLTQTEIDGDNLQPHISDGLFGLSPQVITGQQVLNTEIIPGLQAATEHLYHTKILRSCGKQRIR
jgi:hypothetical protein